MSSLDKNEVIGKNRPEDVRWLASLSDSELDMLISLKNLVIQRAKVVGHEDVANKFDLKMLRGIGFIIMTHFKELLKDSSVISGLTEASTLLNGCNLSKLNKEVGFDSVGIEDIRALIDTNSRKRMAAGPCEDEDLSQKKHK